MRVTSSCSKPKYPITIRRCRAACRFGSWNRATSRSRQGGLTAGQQFRGVLEKLRIGGVGVEHHGDIDGIVGVELTLDDGPGGA